MKGRAQIMSQEVFTGVYPVYQNQFKIGKAGIGSAEADMVTIKDLETFSPSFDNGVEEWTPMDSEGWMRRFMTGKSLSIEFAGKRNVGDAGNDYIASLAFKGGKDTESKLAWIFPSGAKAELEVIINVTNVGGGDSTGVGALEFTVMNNGKPTFTPAPVPQV